MSDYIPTKEHLREVLLLYFNQSKSAAESYRLLVATYGPQTVSISTCEFWFRRFRRGEFNVEDRDRPGQPKKFEDTELKELLDQDPNLTQEELAAALNVSREAISKRLKVRGVILEEARKKKKKKK